VVRLVKDNPVAVAVMKTLIHFPNNDVVGDHVMKAVVGIRPGDVVVGDSTGPTTSVATGWDVTIMIDNVVIADYVIAALSSDPRSGRIPDSVADEVDVMRRDGWIDSSPLAKETVESRVCRLGACNSTESILRFLAIKSQPS